MSEVVRSIPGVSWFQNRVKSVNAYGTKHNVPHVQICLINSFFLIFLGSLKIQTLLFVGLDSIDTPAHAYDLAGMLHIPIWITLTVILLPVVAKFMIRIEKVSSKLIFHLINRIDLILWRKFRIESPVSSRIWGFEQQIRAVSVQTKRKVFLLGLGLYGIYALNRLQLL